MNDLLKMLNAYFDAPKTWLANPREIEKMKKAYEEISKLVENDTVIETGVTDFGDGYIRVTNLLFSFYTTEIISKFNAINSLCSSVEIYTNVNGDVVITFGFADCFKLIG